jgi:hypothetical protein
MQYRANTAGFDDTPDEEGNAANWCDDGLDGEEVAALMNIKISALFSVSREWEEGSHFVNWEPDSRKGNEPKEEET